MEQMQQEIWTPLCFAEKVSQVKFTTKRFVGNALIVLDYKNFRLCDHENYDDLFQNHRIKGGHILIEEVLDEEFKFYKNRIKKCGVMFVEQLIEPYTDKMMKWTHFLKENGLALRIEPKWFKIVRDRITINGILERELYNEMLIKRMGKEDTKKTRSNENLSEKSRKETNKEVITWRDINSNDNICSIRSKKSRYRYYDEIGKHMLEYDKLQENNDVINSPFLINYKGCDYNIRKKKDRSSECYIYIEKDIAMTIPGRWEKDNEDIKYIKPYMTLENIDKRNVSVHRIANTNKEEIIINDMVIDKDKNDLRTNAKLWLNSVIEKMGIYENLNNFIDNDFFDFTDKEIFLQLGGIIQKGPDLNLDGFFGIEIFAKNSKEEKFSIEGKVRNTRNEGKFMPLEL
ncbi:uncharacterized protein OCT59_004882 [Rhizophagus irregularis]|nr:hypothetical protein OCT59_004882 [Rhizophagus irregularis]